MFRTISLALGLTIGCLCSAQSAGPGEVTTTKKGDASYTGNAGGVIVIKCATSQSTCCVIISGLTSSGGGPGSVDIMDRTGRVQKSFTFTSWKDTTKPGSATTEVTLSGAK